MHSLERIDTLLEFNIVMRKLGLETPSATMWIYRIFGFYVLACTRMHLTRKGAHGLLHTFSSAAPNCSFIYCCVRAAKGVNDALNTQVNPYFSVECKSPLRAMTSSAASSCREQPGHRRGSHSIDYNKGAVKAQVMTVCVPEVLPKSLYLVHCR